MENLKNKNSFNASDLIIKRRSKSVIVKNRKKRTRVLQITDGSNNRQKNSKIIQILKDEIYKKKKSIIRNFEKMQEKKAIQTIKSANKDKEIRIVKKYKYLSGSQEIKLPKEYIRYLQMACQEFDDTLDKYNLWLSDNFMNIIAQPLIKQEQIY